MNLTKAAETDGAQFEPSTGGKSDAEYARFSIGERHPWKGLVFRVKSWSGRELTLEVIDVTSAARKRLERAKGKGKRKRNARAATPPPTEGAPNADGDETQG